MDKLLTNKYFCIAILIALAVVIYLYSQSDYCSMESMQNVDLTPLAQELNERPWTNDVGGSTHGRVNTDADIYADTFVKNKLKRNGFNVANFLPRSDTTFANRMRSEDSIETTPTTTTTTTTPTPVVKKKSKRSNKKIKPHTSLPQPLDNRPDLSQCQPCAPCGINKMNDNMPNVSGVSGNMRHSK